MAPLVFEFGGDRFPLLCKLRGSPVKFRDALFEFRLALLDHLKPMRPFGELLLQRRAVLRSLRHRALALLDRHNAIRQRLLPRDDLRRRRLSQSALGADFVTLLSNR